MSRPEIGFIKQAKEQIKTHLKESCGIRLDIPDGIGCGGTSTTGNVAWRLLNNDKNNSRGCLIECVPDAYKDKIDSIIKRHAIILNVLNSKNKVTKLDQFKCFTISLYNDILTWFPYANITPTLHKTLAHSWELIHMNGDFGLGAYSEEGLESCNKLLRKIRISLSRKRGEEENQMDCLLWFRSDP